jgi:hypothetical protein
MRYTRNYRNKGKTKSRTRTRTRAKAKTKTKRGGGIFDSVKSIFTGKATTRPLPQPTIQQRIQENIEKADTECLKIQNLDEESLRQYAIDHPELVEHVDQSFNRLCVFLYLKMKNTLSDDLIGSAHRKQNDTTPIKLDRKQFQELRNAVLANQTLSNEELSMNLFHTELATMDDQIKLWEKANQLIYYENKCIIAFTSAGSLPRAIALLKYSDMERQNVYNRELYQCRAEDYNLNCIFISSTFDVVRGFKNFAWIVVPEGKNFTVKIKDMTRVRIINDAFTKGKMLGVNPRLGYTLQKEYSSLWNRSCWNASNDKRKGVFGHVFDDIDRIVILTLQEHSALRRYEATGNTDWCADIYTHSPRQMHIAHELKNPQRLIRGYEFNEEEFLQELRENQMWAGGKIRYNTIEDLNNLLPTPAGFNPPFVWQILGSKDKNIPKLNKRHANVLRYLAEKRLYTEGSVGKEWANSAKKQANAWETIEGLTHKPQFVTQEEMNAYERNYGVPGLRYNMNHPSTDNPNNNAVYM